MWVPGRHHRSQGKGGKFDVGRQLRRRLKEDNFMWSDITAEQGKEGSFDIFSVIKNEFSS